MFLKGRNLLLPGVALVVLGLDQFTKYLVQRHLAYQVPWNPIAALERYVSLTYVTNTGAAFGLFPGLSVVFTAFSFIVIIAIIIYQRYIPRDSWLLLSSLGLQLGGAIGNLIDRLCYGYVIDFIDFKFWPVFNVADSAISVGAVCLVVYLWLERDEMGDVQQDEKEVSSDNLSQSSALE